MKDQKKVFKTNRQRYFSMVITLGSIGSKIILWTNNSIYSNIHISPVDNFQQCEREKLFPIPKSDFYPGHFSRLILHFEELLRNEQVKEVIKEMPEKYRVLIENKDELESSVLLM